MDNHTWAFVGVLMCIVALAFMDLLTNLRINKRDKMLEKLAALVYKVRSDAWDDCRRSSLIVVEDRKQELDKQERAIHEEMGNLSSVLFKVTSQLKEFTNLADYGHPYADGPLDTEDLDYDYPAPGDRHQAGGGGPGGGETDQADLPPSYGEAGGA